MNNYNSIGHLSNSKLGESDSHIDSKTEDRLTKESARQPGDLVVVQEKVDGSNVGIRWDGDRLVAITRTGRPCEESAHLHHREVCALTKNIGIMKAIKPGERMIIESCFTAHGIHYRNLKLPFFVLDIIDEQTRKPINLFDFWQRCQIHQLPTIPVIWAGGPVNAKRLTKLTGGKSIVSPGDEIEGYVWRLYSGDGLEKSRAKFVYEHFVPGKYFGEAVPLANAWSP